MEVMIVLIVVGILGTLGFTQYIKVLEKARTAEAKSVLSTLRTQQVAHYFKAGSYADLNTLNSDLPLGSGGACADTTYHFQFSCSGASGSCTASRCISGGREPNVEESYDITLGVNGNWSGTAGYY